VDVVLITPPYHRSYSGRVNETAYPMAMRELALRAAREFDIQWIDAGGHEDFASRAELFRDSDHFNDAGRAEFTRWLLQGPLSRSRRAAVSGPPAARGGDHNLPASRLDAAQQPSYAGLAP
jgi:hypothetical protein